MASEVLLRGGPFSGATVCLARGAIVRLGLPDHVHMISWQDRKMRVHESLGLAVYNRTDAVSDSGLPVWEYSELAGRDREPWLMPDQIAILKESEATVAQSEHTV